MPTEVVVAIIAAVPPTLASLAALNKAHKAEQKLSVSNGHQPGFMIEETWEATKHLTRTVHEIDKRLEVHVLDQQVHCNLSNPCEE